MDGSCDGLPGANGESDAWPFGDNDDGEEVASSGGLDGDLVGGSFDFDGVESGVDNNVGIDVGPGDRNGGNDESFIEGRSDGTEEGPLVREGSSVGCIVWVGE